jgi:hypothetical protein
MLMIDKKVLEELMEEKSRECRTSGQAAALL